MNILPVSQKTLNRFWAKVDIPSDKSLCWNWNGAVTSGCGCFRLDNSSTIKVHRFVYLLHLGEIPDGKRVLHKCRNPLCCNPSHLKLGEEVEERFWRQVAIAGQDDCWLWKSRCAINGYGQFSIKKKTLVASRVAYELSYGPIPDKHLVCHKCDNPPCCNPRHLFLGTCKENQEDMTKKGRGRFGERAGRSAKLTEGDIPEIRKYLESGNYSQEQIAQKFGVNQATVSCIKRGVRWSHVN